MPPGVIIPVLPYTDVSGAAVWLCRAFGFVERLRISDHRVQLTFGEAGQASVVVCDRPALVENPDDASGFARVMVRVADVDAHHAAAAGAGARVLSPPTVYPYGEKQYTAEDPGGHQRTFSQSVADVGPAEWGGVSPASP